MRLNNSLLLLASVGLISLSSVTTSVAYAQATEQQKVEHKSYRASKKVPAMRNRVYAQLARAQKLADEGDKIEGFEVLDQVKDRIDSLNSYEQAMLFNFYGFMYYANEDVDMAIDSFNKVISDEKAIPDSLIISTLYSLAQLSMQQQNYAQALTYLEKWQAVNPKDLTANQHILFAQVHYQDKQYDKSLAAINDAIAMTEQENKIPKENWLILQRAAYYELKQPEQVTKVMEKLVRLYDKPEYWLQLSGMYGEIGQEEKQIAVMEAAYQAGYVTKSSDISTLAQLYLFHGAPYKSAKLLQKAIDEGSAVADEKSLDVIARAYLTAKEDDKAIQILTQLSMITESGKYDAMLAQALLNNEQWQAAIVAANTALTRINVTLTASNNNDEALRASSEKELKMHLGNMYLVQGMANFNLKQFEQSLQAFAQAVKLPKTKKTAEQWAKYVEREQRNHNVHLAMLN
ncbi:tetratricopeptide repeat protein [Litorilituus lipolyticus]|uniref:Tetratricopeptide repeat protein n=1 Tax=Litorilituus lipolyticus TaxID=2491017 RepID=A0A502KSS1_9GAMM|nr:hypothetical protein [Litorilituus lipolyticus]TPH14214.1 hypothetical protein EPA86_11845 [Litorilituus lipolyticus]